MASRRRGTPIPLRPVAAVVKLSRRRQAKSQAKQDRKFRSAVISAAAGKPVNPSEIKVESADVRKARGRAFRYRHRKTLGSVYVGAVLALSKAMLHLSWTALPGMLLAVVLAVAAVLWIRRTSTTATAPQAETIWPRFNTLVGQIPDRFPRVAARLSPRCAAITVTVLAGLWWVLPLHVRPAAWSMAITITLACIARRRRFRIRVVETTPQTREEDWANYIAKSELAGSKMAGSDPLASPRDGRLIGWTAGIVLPRGSKGAQAVATDELRGRIGTVWDVGRTGVLFDVPRDSEQRFVVTVIDQDGGNALDEVHPFTASDFSPDTGIFTHGVRADWQPAKVRSYDPDAGAYHWHFSGANGAGKSEGIENVLRQTTQHGVVVPIFCDLGDLTYTDWEPYTPIMETDPLRCLMVLENIVELIQHRQRKMKRMRRYDADGVDIGVRRVYPISRSTPLIQLVFDEWHLLWANTTVIGPGRQDTIGSRALAATAFAVGQGRKAMVSELLATQSTSVVEGFGNSPYIRQQCQAGNMVGYRNGATAGGQAFGGEIVVDPSTIPKDRKGTSFLTSPVDSRDAMARTIWVQEPMKLNPLIDIPQLPADELVILRRGLDGQAAPVVETSEPAEPRKTSGPSPELVLDVRRYIENTGKVRRQVIVDHFRKMGRGSSTAIDNALKELRQDESVVSKGGVYAAKESV
jgi:uncharacterized membrane protein YphA (DoxX/SURF4 family)